MTYDLLPMEYIEPLVKQINARIDEGGVYFDAPFPVENALEVITGDIDTDAETLTWLYSIGALNAADLCYQSYMDCMGY